MKNLFETYLKGVNKYTLKVNVDSKSICILKKVIDIDKPFYLNENGENICILNNGYSILEYMPLNENYICRIHLDNQLNIIEYFFIVSLDNRFENNMPIYRDAKLSVVYCNGICKLYNQDVAKKMLDDAIINITEYEDIYKVANKILYDIKNNSNEIVNNVTDLIKRSDF